jgi:hypothetical protein
MPRPRTYATEYQARKAKAEAEGWTGYGQKRYQLARWTPEHVKELADKCCGGAGHEPERAGSLLCGHCNSTVNPRSGSREGDWRARLVRAAK